MGFWNKIWSGIKSIAGVTGSIIGGGAGLLGKVTQGYESAGPAGAIAEGIGNIIPSISHTVKRVGHYVSYAKSGQDPGMAAFNELTSGVSSLASIGPINDAIRNVSAAAPDSIKHLATVGAAFHDKLQSTNGDIVAAARSAGANPLSAHLANSASNAVTTAIGGKLGVNARILHQMRDPVTRASSLISKVNAYHSKVVGNMNHEGPERSAVRAMGASVPVASESSGSPAAAAASSSASSDDPLLAIQ